MVNQYWFPVHLLSTQKLGFSSWSKVAVCIDNYILEVSAFSLEFIGRFSD